MGYVSIEVARAIRAEPKKRCRRCNELRLLDHFRPRKNKRGEYVRYNTCRYCEALIALEYARKRRGQKICEHCGSLYIEKKT